MSRIVHGRILIYGGKGALGSYCVLHFKTKKWWIISVDVEENEEADVNVVPRLHDTVTEQEDQVVKGVLEALQDDKLDAILCVAGGWIGGNAEKGLISASVLMFRQTVWSSLIATSVATKCLADGGLLVLPGASLALQPTPGMLAYGMAKAAVHHLVSSLGNENSGLPNGCVCVALLPVTLDTKTNRSWMSDADFSSWTPLKYVAELVWKWIVVPRERPPTGSLVQLVTKNFVTDAIVKKLEAC